MRTANTTTDGYQLADVDHLDDLLVTVQRPNGTVETISLKAKGIHHYVNSAEGRTAFEAANEAAGNTILGYEAVTTTVRHKYCIHYTPDQGCPLHGETCR